MYVKDHALFVYFTHHIPHRIQHQWKEQPHTEEPSKDENIVFYSCYKDFACSGVIGAPQLMPRAVPVFVIVFMDTSGIIMSNSRQFWIILDNCTILDSHGMLLGKSRE